MHVYVEGPSRVHYFTLGVYTFKCCVGPTGDTEHTSNTILDLYCTKTHTNMRCPLFNSRRRMPKEDVDERIRARSSIKGATHLDVSFRRKLTAYRLPLAVGVIFVFLFGVFVCYHVVPVPQGFSAPWKLRAHVIKVSLNRKINAWFGSQGLKQESPYVANRSNSELLITTQNFNGVKVRIYKPTKGVDSSKHLPVLVYYHGGGWIHFNADPYDMLLTHVAIETKILIISVDYRLAPEHPFPAPLDDCVSVTKYVFEHNTTLGIDSYRVAIGGDSSGANLAAAVALKLRDIHAKITPKLQVLVYPPLQAIDFSLPSYVQNSGGPLLTPYSMASMWSKYACGSDKYARAMVTNSHTTLEAKKSHQTNINHMDIPEEYRFKPYSRPNMRDGDAKTWDELKEVLENPYFAPLMAKYLMYLPATFLYTAHYDILRDDGLLYAKKLEDASVSVTHIHGTTSIHGTFNAFLDFAEAGSCLEAVIECLKQQL